MKRQSIVSGAMVLGVGMLLVKLLGLLCKIPLSRILGTAGMGYFSASYTLFTAVYGLTVTGLTGAALRAYRRRVAMIFQSFGLLSQKTVLANACFPYLAATGRVTSQNRERALQLLDLVGMADRADSYPSQLSGGQQQRVAIARALACEPEYILCDEATSALDPASTNTVLKLLRQINRETGVTIIVITHSMGVVEKICKNVVVLERGHVVERGSVADVFAAPQSQAAKVLLERVDWDA